jgi:hypothetical protein
MAEQEVDAADNPGVRACLAELEQLHSKFLSRNDAFWDVKPDNLAGLALSERQRVQEQLTKSQSATDFDPLALSAMQEAIRTAARPESSGFEVSIQQVADAMGKIDHLSLWEHFLRHYIGNLLEWQVSAAGDGQKAEEVQNTVAALRRTVAPHLAKSAISAVRKNSRPSADIVIGCLAEALRS